MDSFTSIRDIVLDCPLPTLLNINGLQDSKVLKWSFLTETVHDPPPGDQAANAAHP
jgi:hypothetical protein